MEIFLAFKHINRGMDASIPGSSTKPIVIQDTSEAQHTGRQWDLGPDLKSPSLLKRVGSISWYICKNHFTEIAIMVTALLLLVIGIFKWDVLFMPTHFQNTTVMPSSSTTNWADWWMRIQSFMGVGTLLVALLVWYSGIRKDWENHLPKRMTVFFFHLGRPVIICRYVWLADGDDLRAWGQQVSAQAADTDRRLEFSPKIRTKDPSLIVETKESRICRHYSICFQLNRLPASLDKDPEICRYQNFSSEDNSVHSIPSDIVATLEVVTDWQQSHESCCVNPDKSPE